MTETAKKIEIQDRRKKVAANLLSGMNYRDLAATLDVSIGTISSDVKAILKSMQAEQVKDYRQVIILEVRRIDRALNAIWNKVLEGNFKAIETMTVLQNQRAKYFGLYAPDEVINTEAKVEDLETIRQRRWESIAPQLAEALSDDGERGNEDPDSL